MDAYGYVRRTEMLDFALSLKAPEIFVYKQFNLILSALGPSLNVRILRPQTSDSDV